MALPATIDEAAFQAFPEPIQQEYAKQPTGEYRLDVTPVGGLGLENATALKATINKATKAQRALETQLGSYGTVKITASSELEFEPTLTVEGHERTVAELEATKKTLSETDPKKRVEEARAQAIQETTGDLTRKHKVEMETLQATTQKATAELRQTRQAFTVSDALVKSGAKSIGLLTPVLERATGFDDDNKPYVKDGEWEVRYSTVTGEPMTHLELAEELKGQDDYKVCWPADDASGTGGTPEGATGKSPGGIPTLPTGFKVC